MSRHRVIGIVAIGIFLLGANAAWGQPVAGYPSRALRMIVAFPAGGPTDIQARLIGRKLNEALGQPVVIDNRGGAGGMIGAEAAAHAAPDGYTVFLATMAVVTAPLTQQKPPYDTVKDLAAITMVSATPYVMLVHPSVPARSVKEYIALAKSRPGQLNYGSSGSGTPPHLAGELLKGVAGIDVVHIPYKGSAPALTDLLAGQVSMVFNNPLTALPQARAGKVRALAVTARKRSIAAPDLPTLAEAGVPGAEVEAWFALLAPAATPQGVIARLNAETLRILGNEEVRSRMQADGAETVGGTPGEVSDYIRSEVVKWSKVVKQAGLRMD